MDEFNQLLNSFKGPVKASSSVPFEEELLTVDGTIFARVVSINIDPASPLEVFEFVLEFGARSSSETKRTSYPFPKGGKDAFIELGVEKMAYGLKIWDPVNETTSFVQLEFGYLSDYLLAQGFVAKARELNLLDTEADMQKKYNEIDVRGKTVTIGTGDHSGRAGESSEQRGDVSLPTNNAGTTQTWIPPQEPYVAPPPPIRRGASRRGEETPGSSSGQRPK